MLPQDVAAILDVAERWGPGRSTGRIASSLTAAPTSTLLEIVDLAKPSLHVIFGAGNLERISALDHQ